ncbi:unnamed protein product [Amoebophrya sp. A120]|nr:unnamed protein product [Amoebophrya sp. A120]|eukprot:GSA120T00014615001.1
MVKFLRHQDPSQRKYKTVLRAAGGTTSTSGSTENNGKKSRTTATQQLQGGGKSGKVPASAGTKKASVIQAENRGNKKMKSRKNSAGTETDSDAEDSDVEEQRKADQAEKVRQQNRKTNKEIEKQIREEEHRKQFARKKQFSRQQELQFQQDAADKTIELAKKTHKNPLNDGIDESLLPKHIRDKRQQKAKWRPEEERRSEKGLALMAKCLKMAYK